MSDALSAVIVAVIMAVSSLVCQVLINRSNRTKRVQEDAAIEKEKAVVDARKDEQLQSRLKDIEGKLDEHNGYAKMLAEVSKDIAVIKNDIKTLYKRGVT